MISNFVPLIKNLNPIPDFSCRKNVNEINNISTSIISRRKNTQMQIPDYYFFNRNEKNS